MKKRKPKMVMQYKCDHCGSMTSSFVVTAKYQHFCREQVVGYEPTKDCMSDYLQSKKMTLKLSL